MSKRPSAAVAALASSSPRTVPENTLRAIREAATAARDKVVEKAELDERAKELGREILEYTQSTLPTMLKDAGLSGLELARSSNLPPFELRLKPYYHANIDVGWEPDRKDRAFEWLDREGHGDLVKTIITVELGRGTARIVRAVCAALKKLKVDYTMNRGVPWNTLTALVKEIVEDKAQPMPPLDVLGATVGDVVTIKPKKEK